MRLKYNQTMATAIEQLVIDPQSRFLEMKSLQPYSTRDEYLYAMKEDLADWLSNMYPDWRPITADNFLECLENGVLLCQHANNVNDAARKTSSSIILTNCKYRSNVRPQTFNARDNVSQFIKWSRRIAGVREVLMFESDDLILRKNEKNFLLCLLEIARFGAKFGVSVPAIIKLEDEIEREIARDKQIETLSFPESNHLPIEDINHQTDMFTLSNANWLNQDLSNFVDTNNEDSFEEITTTIITSNEDAQGSKPVGEREKKPIVPPASSSHLHKTVVQIVNSCCCSQRFPVIRIGEGKYRIGENGTIIFIRILRNHVMVRVGGGWDTLENYLNKHDPCRRSGGHHRSEHHHHHHSDVPILAIPNTNISPSVQKNTPFGKSVTIKTEEFPLAKPSTHDTNLLDAQLVITRGADGRHRIGQITYKSEGDILNQPAVCPHHHNQSSPTMKTKNVRNTTRFTPSTIYNKQSSPSTDQDYSSLTETTPSKPSSISSLEFKEESIEQPMKTLNINTMEHRPVRHYSPVRKSQAEPLKPSHETFNNLTKMKPSITESVIDSIDGYNHSTIVESKCDFDINDIDEVMGITNKKLLSDEDATNIDNDSLESSEGVLEEKPIPPPLPPTQSLPPATKKSGGYCSAFYLAQKQKFQQEQAANRRRSAGTINRYSSRSSTLPNVVDAIKKEEQVNKPRRKPISITQRSQSSDLVEKINDISKLDRDSGFDEQDFRRERLQSNGDDNSSISSIKSARSSIHFDYRENKSYELRMKKLDAKRTSTEKNLSVKSGRNSSSTSRRKSDMIPPTPPPPPPTNKYRKNSQPVANLKQ